MAAIKIFKRFKELLDAPSSYTGSRGKSVTVKSTEDGLEFTTLVDDPPITKNDYGRNVTIPDTGILNQPDEFDLSGTETLTLVGSARLNVFDSLGNPPQKGSFQPGPFDLRSGEFMRQYDHLILNADHDLHIEGDASLTLYNDPPFQQYSGYAALGSPILGETIGVTREQITQSVPLTDGVSIYQAIFIPAPCVASGVKFYMSAQGTFTGDNNNKIALYSYLNGALTQVAVSANDPTIWKFTTGTVGSAKFSAPYTSSPGLYYVAALWNNSSSSGTPAVGGTNTSSVPILTGVCAWDYSSSGKIFGTRTSQNDLPTTELMSNLSINANRLYFCLY